ncbi:bifunctional folylpolyglutamate synthase/dihydrofolate synthase [Ureibacillus manganicus]|uniref:tetrahydrofolate synthase n=1 Tax=Ureibacillus manganicus DSM 26584 TaxID=1384049 RepID=A0A0A3I1R5_9BACL|nr:folylpolyglutamate synthase/dihydrofolate synthase family protein [Ureibacillus manganicus]KGR78664.1 folylpolyglutamate synthase [Ureibacillus manganicus DSM 26584]
MFRSIEECTNFIFQLKASQYKGKPLEAVQIILKELGNPHFTTKFIHFAGSNGKGSTLNATREILMTHGLQVGAFTSPHLERANERVTINKNQITDEKFLHYANLITEVIEDKLDGKYPTFFEMMMLIAFQHFANEEVDVALIETGIGGRVDSTNIITPEVSVITTISLEHTEILGDTYEKIAFEKAGIIKEGVPVVVGAKNEKALLVIEDRIKAMKSDSYFLGKDIQIIDVVKGNPQQFSFSFNSHEIMDIPLLMVGEHQVENAALAITASILFDLTISAETIRTSLRNAKWEGRFERIGEKVIIDGAHNSEGTSSLINTLKEVEPNKKYKFVYAALQDKDHHKSIEMMDQVAHKMSFTEISLPRRAKAEILASQSNHHTIAVDENWRRLIENELAELCEDEILIVTGSLYFIADVRQFLKNFLKKEG